MKTSNKILVITAIIIAFGLFLQSYILRNAYQKALKNPQSRFVKVDLKLPKYLNINHHWNVNFKQSTKFQIQILNGYKDSLRYNYFGDSLNLDARNAGEMTVFTPKLPKLSFNCDKGNDLQVFIDNSFKSDSLDAKIINSCNFIIGGSKFENINLVSYKKIKLILEDCEIKSLNLNLPKHSEIELNYSKIGSKNFVLGDSCSVKTSGKDSGVIQGKYYGTILK